jgi:amidophosphoribosyltransferase
LVNAQPFQANLMSGPVALAHNGNLVNDRILRRKLQSEGSIFHGSSDSEIFLHLISRSRHRSLVEALREAMDSVQGAYSLVVLGHQELLAARDPHGFRPLVLGKKRNDRNEEVFCVASETCAFDLIEAELVREVQPGEILRISAEGVQSFQASNLPPRAACIFEHIYFARPDSLVFGRSVYASRQKFGERLAEESPIEADLVVPVPDSGVAAALGYSRKSGIPFEMGIIRNHYIGRSFIQPHQSIRHFGVKIKLNPQSSVLKGKRLVVVDDSLVRGTTSQKIVRLLRAAGAKEVHMRIAAPPSRDPCFYGVDTPQKAQLIAARMDVQEIRSFLDADSLAYLSLEGLHEVMNSPREGFCSACFDGRYPTSLPGQQLEGGN